MNDKDRINRVITRSGDRGRTGLADGSRLSKAAPVIEALGAVDELNAALGVLLAESLPERARLTVQHVQQQLFEIGAELAVPGSMRLDEAVVQKIETEAQRLNETLPPLKEFVLPGGSRAGAWCHYCRTLARRAERTLVAVADVSVPASQADSASGRAPEAPSSVNPSSLRWLNRLSDLLFILARDLNREAGVPETVWQPQPKPR